MPPPKKTASKTVKAKDVAPAPKRKAEPAIDFESDKNSATPESLKEITTMADRHAELQLLVVEEQEYMKTLSDELYRLENVSIPEAMTQAGLETFKTTSGASVSIVPFVECNLPAAGAIDKAKGEEKEELQLRLAEGLKYIADNEGEAIIKSLILINFEKGEKEKKDATLQALVEAGHTAIAAEQVHPQTLKSWIKEKLSKGVAVPFDTFKIYSGTKAEVKLSKSK